MGARAKIIGSSAFIPAEDSDTVNVQSYVLESTVEIEGATNSVAQIRIDMDDYAGGGSDPVIHIAMGFTEGNFTVLSGDLVANIITTGAAHCRAEGDIVIFSTTGTLPSPLAAAVPYYVHTVPAADKMVVGTSMAASSANLTNVGTGVHSWVGYGASGGAKLTYDNLAGGPVVPVIVKDLRSGRPDDFSKIKGLQIMLLPTNPAAMCGGQVLFSTGVSSTPLSHFIVPLEISGGVDTNPRTVATFALPHGAPYGDGNGMALHFDYSQNLSVLLNIFGR